MRKSKDPIWSNWLNFCLELICSEFGSPFTSRRPRVKAPPGSAADGPGGIPAWLQRSARGTTAPGSGRTGSRGRRDAPDTAEQHRAGPPAAQTGRHLSSPGYNTLQRCPLSPALASGASGSPLLPPSVSQDPGAPLHIHANPWKGNQACQAGLRSQDSKFYSWLCHSLPPTSGARHFPPGKQTWIQGSSWFGG